MSIGSAMIMVMELVSSMVQCQDLVLSFDSPQPNLTADVKV